MATIEHRPASGGIGESVLRKEDAAFITGQGRYIDDLKLPGMLHACFVRSPMAHADITSIDTAAAEAMPGVVAVLTAQTLGISGGVPCASNPTGDTRQPRQPILAEGVVRYAGEPVAMVIAADRYQARDAADSVAVDYDPKPVVTDARAALEADAPRVHADYPDNLCCTLNLQTDGVDAAFAAAKHVVRSHNLNQRLTPIAMETRGVIADWIRSTGEVTLYTSTQVPHFVRTFVAVINETSESKVRVVAPDVGGGFGSKLNTYREEYATAAASKRVGAPVKWIEDRSENIVATTHGRDQYQSYEAAVDDDGRVTALRFDAVQNNGAYLQLLTPAISQLTLFMVPGPYTIPDVSIRIRQAFTHTTPTDAYRGAGRPEATYGLERLMDEIAGQLGLDPADVRRRNFIDSFPHTTACGLAYDSGDYHRALELALDHAGYASFAQRRREALDRGRYRGIGLSSYVEVCGLAPSAVTKAIGLAAPGWESSTVRMHPFGKVTVITGSSPHGQGHATSWSQIVASELGVGFDDVEVIHGDTAFAPYGLGTYGSRSLAVAGTALYRSLQKIKDKARLIAAHELECAAEDLEWGEGRWQVRGSPERGRTIQELGTSAWVAASLPEGVEPGMEATTFHDPPNFTFPFGTHVCEVEVDPDTGRVEICDYVAVDDCGNVINPMIVDGQVQGGVAQSIAQALFEETVYTDDGQLRTPTLVEYQIPSAADLPAIRTDRTVTPSPVNPLGVKGVGEAGTIAAASAVVNAVANALAPLGVRDLEMPLQPARVWHAIRSAEPTGGAS
jgi:aerobic carbon-monoxide dehydrogenase large subunit